MTKVPKWVWIAALGAVLTLPMLGSFGLWDPAEIRQADVARAVAEKGSFSDITVGGKYSPRPVLHTWLVAVGFKLFGINELAGRLPLALCFIGALLLGYRSVRRVFDENTALAATFVLATTPVFLFQGRQLVSDIVFYAALIASLGGLLAFIAPADHRRQRWDLLIAACGLVAGFLARGLVIGTVLPLAAVILAIAVAWTFKLEGDAEDKLEGDTEGEPEHGEAMAAQSESGDSDEAAEASEEAEAEGYRDNAAPDIEPPARDWVLAAELKDVAKPLAITLVAVGAVIGGLVVTLAQGKYMVMGGIFHKLALPPTFDKSLRDLAFGAFPWIAVAPLALWSFGAAQRESLKEPGQQRDRFVQLAFLLVISLGYLLTVLWPGLFGKVRFIPLPWIMLATGIWAYQAYRRGLHGPFWGVVAAVLILALQQDFFMQPKSLAFSHLIDHARYPQDLNIKFFARAFGLELAVVAFFMLGGLPGAVGKIPTIERRSWWHSVVAFLAFVPRHAATGVGFLGRQMNRAGGPNNQRLWIAFAASALVFAAWCSLWLTPQLSYHMSNKALFQTYHQCKGDGERLAQYRVSGRGAAYYNKGQVDAIKHQGQLFDLLRKPKRAFVLIPATYLGSIDQAARQRKVTYHVLDDRNSHYLIVSNKLGNGCDKDKNPLRELVLRKRPIPQHKVNINFENKVELIGYDLDRTVTRGGSFQIKLYFHVLGRVPANYKIFIHFDKPASRFHGDHKPLGGKYPTQYWLKGDYIIDPHKVELPLLTTSSGRYEVMMGFWQGSRRLKVVKGPHDGVNRAKLGFLRVR